MPNRLATLMAAQPSSGAWLKSSLPSTKRVLALQTTEQIKPRTLDIAVLASFGAIYLLWGSTYFAIRVAAESLPPLFAASMRFTVAGAILYAWNRFRGEPAPSRKEWANVWLLGALMFLCGYGGLFWAETSLASGIASVLVATIPLWVILLEALVFRTQRFRMVTGWSVLLGLLGVSVLALDHDNLHRGLTLSGCVAILFGEIGWSLGTVLSKTIKLPPSKALGSGAEMFTGGVLLLVAALFAGELVPLPRITASALLAEAYLIIAGSLIAFTAYVWLLGRMSSTKVTTYAYVNPVIALIIGHWLGGEDIQPTTMVGTLLVLVSVALVMGGKTESV